MLVGAMHGAASAVMELVNTSIGGRCAHDNIVCSVHVLRV